VNKVNGYTFNTFRNKIYLQAVFTDPWQAFIYNACLLLYGFVLSTKLNFVFYIVPFSFLMWKSLGFLKGFLFVAVIPFMQIVIGIPFLLANWKSYVFIAYDISRELLWEKTRNFKFVGRELYANKIFHIGLVCDLLMLLLCCCVDLVG